MKRSLCLSGVFAGLDLHHHMEACGPRGGRSAGPGDHGGEVFGSTRRKRSPTVRLWASPGETGGPQGPNSAVAYEGEIQQRGIRSRRVSSRFPSPCLSQRCVFQLLFLLLLLMVNYQDRVEQGQARLLHSAISRSLHTAPSGNQNLTSLME